MRTLTNQQPLSQRHRAHPLKGEWRGFMECHVHGDWLLIWYTTGTEIVFVRTGTHADLFE